MTPASDEGWKYFHPQRATLAQLIHHLPDLRAYLVAWPIAARCWESRDRRGGLLAAPAHSALVDAGAQTYTARSSAVRAARALPFTLALPTSYLCYGQAQGWCGHHHTSPAAAARCWKKHRRFGRWPWQVSDREVVALDAGALDIRTLTDHEQRELNRRRGSSA